MQTRKLLDVVQDYPINLIHYFLSQVLINHTVHFLYWYSTLLLICVREANNIKLPVTATEVALQCVAFQPCELHINL